MRFECRTMARPKAMSKRLQKCLPELPLARCQRVTALTLGYRDWRDLETETNRSQAVGTPDFCDQNAMVSIALIQAMEKRFHRAAAEIDLAAFLRQAIFRDVFCAGRRPTREDLLLLREDLIDYESQVLVHQKKHLEKNRMLRYFQRPAFTSKVRDLSQFLTQDLAHQSRDGRKGQSSVAWSSLDGITVSFEWVPSASDGPYLAHTARLTLWDGGAAIDMMSAVCIRLKSRWKPDLQELFWKASEISEGAAAMIVDAFRFGPSMSEIGERGAIVLIDENTALEERKFITALRAMMVFIEKKSRLPIAAAYIDSSPPHLIPVPCADLDRPDDDGLGKPEEQIQLASALQLLRDRDALMSKWLSTCLNRFPELRCTFGIGQSPGRMVGGLTDKFELWVGVAEIERLSESAPAGV